MRRWSSLVVGISGAVDIAVAPFSAFQGSSDQDMAGVYSVSYEILRQNPHTLDYEPAAPDEGNFRERHLMEMRGEIPHGDSPGYRALFPDGYLPPNGGAPDPFWWYNMNAYIVTNSGAVDPSQWTSGWHNLYTASGYVNDWNDGICQGAWDTFLANRGISGVLSSNRKAFFPDGRYAVEVNAVSQGSRESGSEILPVDDLNKPFPVTRGIIVDNFLPGVGVVIVYSKSGSSVDPKYMAKWMGAGSSDTSEYQEQLAYLEELHEDLRFFQSLELGEEVAVPESFPIDPDLPGGFIAGASYSTAPVSSGNTASEVNSVFPVVEGYGVSTDIGIDPVVFLQEEIARVEGELDSYGNRNLDVSQYGYIPYGGASSSVDGESLNMLVIYSEPTMVRNSSGQTITDKIYMLGYIHENSIWDSRDHGTFVRDTPAGNAEHTAYLQEQMGSAFPSEPDAEYAVHYTFQGNLPSGFCGSIVVLIGTGFRSSTTGPRDLAGHLMDANPGTIPATRKGYESWASVAPGSHPGYESQSDPHYYWGVPRWTPGIGKVYATISSDTVAVVDLASIGMGGTKFFGGCIPWYGFWLYKDTDGEHGFNVPVVRHNGTIRHHVFTTKYPKGNPNEDSMFWAGGPGEQERAVSLDQQYFWVSGSECNTLVNYSTAHIYSVNSETGATNIHDVCSGWCSNSFLGDLMFPCSQTAVMKIYESGAALIMYGYFPYPWSEPINGYKVYYPPGGVNMDFPDEPSLVMQAEDFALSDNEPFTILSNPVGETLDVEIACASWNLSVFDISGRCVVSESGVSTEDRSVISIDAGMLPSGVYMLKVEIEGVEQLQSITVVH